MPSKNRTALVGLFWVLFSVGGQQAVRLTGNLILTRLLAPELFGLMLIVNAILTGLAMFSDIGIRGSIINSSRANDKVFLDTAWTLQILRGAIIFTVLLLIAYPAQLFYGNDSLALIIIIAGSSSIVSGFTTTKIYTNEKSLALKRVSVIDFASQLIGMLMMIALAWWLRNIWALVFGSMLAIFIKVFLSQVLLPGLNNHFCLERPAVKEVIGYGKWILLSTAGLYLSAQGDRLLLGRYIELDTLGVYSIAITFALMVGDIAESVAMRLLFPLYKQIGDAAAGASEKIKKVRFLFLLGCVLFCLPLTTFGDWIIEFLYDERYKNAGWMLQLLALASVFRLFDITLRPLLLANRDSYRSMVYQMIKGGLFIALMILGAELYGFSGIIASVIFAPILSYFVLTVMTRKYGYRWLWLDLGCIVFVSCIVLSLWWVTGAEPWNEILAFEAKFQ